jgi:hypothetical protein
MVLSGTLAVTRVNWATDSESQVLTASSEKLSPRAETRAPQEVLRDRLLTDLQERDRNPGEVLTELQQEIDRHPSLAKHCAAIAHSLGRATVAQHGPTRAQSYSRPVCDTAFASGVAQATG